MKNYYTFVLTITNQITNDMNTATIEKSQIELNEQILFSRPNSLIVCRIVEMTEKAVKVDYAVEPISFNNSPLTVYTHSVYIPKSVIIHDSLGGLTVKKWFQNNFKGGYSLKSKYFIKQGNKVIL